MALANVRLRATAVGELRLVWMGPPEHGRAMTGLMVGEVAARIRGRLMTGPGVVLFRVVVRARDLHVAHEPETERGQCHRGCGDLLPRHFDVFLIAMSAR